MFAIKRRSRSADELLIEDPDRVLFSEEEQLETGIHIYDHPLESYKKYIQTYVKNDFAVLKKKISDPVALRKAIKKVQPKHLMRVRSQDRLYSSLKQKHELKPKDAIDILQIQELDFNIKLCDMGNACYIDRHYSDVIQTREYRSPEVILEGQYDESADIWSLACMIFELITGDYLFDPKKGKTFKKNDDHLALMSELIGEMKPDDIKNMKQSCEAWDDYFEPTNQKATTFKLKRIKSLKPWPLHDVLSDKYRLHFSEARLLSNFLGRMLRWQPKNRASARELLKDPWLKVGDLENKTHMSKEYYNEWRKATKGEDPTTSEESESESSDSGEQGASEEDGQTIEQEKALTLLQTVPDATGLNYK